jgi:enamine deaminase RidA (YjgF/YER057c/UK114 family)
MQQSIYVEGFAHGNPIPAGCRIGNMLMTGVISGKDARTGKHPETLAAECAAVFRHVREIVEAAGMTTGDIIKMTVWLKDHTDRKVLNAEWVKMFPDPQHRPARMVMPHLAGGDSSILCDITAVA